MNRREFLAASAALPLTASALAGLAAAVHPRLPNGLAQPTHGFCGPITLIFESALPSTHWFSPDDRMTCTQQVAAMTYMADHDKKPGIIRESRWAAYWEESGKFTLLTQSLHENQVHPYYIGSYSHRSDLKAFDYLSNPALNQFRLKVNEGPINGPKIVDCRVQLREAVALFVFSWEDLGEHLVGMGNVIAKYVYDFDPQEFGVDRWRYRP